MIMLFAVSIRGMYQIQQQYDQFLSVYCVKLLTSVTNSFSKVLSASSNYMTSIATDSSLQSILSKIKDADSKTALGIMRNSRSVLQGYLNSNINPGLFALGVWTDKGSFYNSTYYSDNGFDPELGNKFTEEELHTVAQSVPLYQHSWITKYINYGLVSAQHVHRISPMKLDDMGVVIGCLDLEKLITACTAGMEQDDFSFSLYDSEGVMFYKHNTIRNEAQSIKKQLKGRTYTIWKSEAGTRFAVSGKFPNYGWDFVYTIPYDKIIISLRTQQMYVVFTLLVCMSFSLVGAAVLLRLILADLDKLMDMSKKVSRADFKSVSITNEDQKRQDELGLLLRQFGAMSCQIDCLLRDNYQSKLLAQEAQLQALEMQINPHFLYNTLESVRCCAKLGMNKEVCLIVESLGNMLRFIMNNDNNEIYLGQELHLIDNYIAIQTIRFGDKLKFLMNIDESCFDAVLPKLILLPLIENAVIHGVENKTAVCQIQFTVTRKDKYVCVQVKNTGTQFKEDLLMQLRHNQIKATRNGIGLLNVDNRLKLFFQQEYELKFYNISPYAVAEVTFSYWKERKKEGGFHAETRNS